MKIIFPQQYPSPVFIFSLVLSMCLLAANAQAHTETGVTGGLLSGLLHPVYGPDHLIAMVAVGLWGAQLGNPAIWILPITFPMVMAFGGLLGIAGIPIPGIEIGIALSAVLLGIVVAFSFKPPLWAAAVIVAIFGIFHGHAHGTELPNAANPLAYGVGFVLSTGLLHLAGILIGTLTQWSYGKKLVRSCGVIISTLGAYFLLGATGLLG